MTAPVARRPPPPPPPLAKSLAKEAEARKGRASFGVGRYEPFRYVSTGREGACVLARLPDATDFVELRHVTIAREHPARWMQIEATASIYAMLEHPGWVRLLDQELSGDVPVLVFAGVESEPLASALPLGRATQRDVVNMAELLAHALGAAHRLGLVHGRLGPSAVRVVEGRAPLLDFAWLDVGGEHTPLDALCAPPELGHEPLDASSDVYSLGMLMAVSLLGRAPTPDDTFGMLDEIVLSMLATEREARPTAAEICIGLRMIARFWKNVDGTRTNASTPTDALASTMASVPPSGELAREPRSQRVAVGRALGRYQLVQKLGEGGMGEVYRAIDLGSGTEAAIKVLRPEASADPLLLRRFRKEARILGEVESPYVAGLLEINQDDGIEYIALEYVDGTDLASVQEAAGGRLVEREALSLVADVCRGLAEAHARGIVHRDIKPENVLIARAGVAGGGEPRVKLCDFGIARLLDETPGTLALTRAGSVLGTPYFMAPEQCMGAPVSPATDVYALGVTLFTLMSGRALFDVDEPMALMLAHAHKAPPLLTVACPDASEATAEIVARALAKAPVDRFVDASALLEAIERVLRGEPTSIAVHPARPVMQPERVVSHVLTFDVAASPEALWPFVANTDRLNRALGMLPAAFERKSTGDEVETTGTNRIAGIDMQWREHPFEWVEGRRWGVLRVFTRGIMRWLTVELELAPKAGGGTTIRFVITSEPKTWLARLIVAAEVRFKQKPALAAAFARIDGYASAREAGTRLPAGADAFEAPKPITAANRVALEAGLSKLRDAGVAKPVVEAIAAFCEHAPAQQVARLRPLAFARAQRLDPDQVVEACLHAAHDGLFVLMWDVLCPLCRIPSSFADTLKALSDHSHCASCNADFALDFAQSLELVFRVSPEVRESEVRTYCVGAPAFSPHVVAQVRLAPGERVALDLALGVGTYKIRSPQLPSSFPVEVAATGRAHRASVRLRGTPPLESERVLLTTGVQSISVENALEHELVVRLERTAPREDALTAARASCLASFRRLFPGEVLANGRLVAVGRTAFLVTAVHGQRELLKSLGDARAFERVLEHLDVLEAVVAGEGGAVVKTASGATLSAFESGAAASRAAVSLRARLDAATAERPSDHALDVRLVVHQGPTVAATLDGRLDYFGETVETALELVPQAPMGAVLLSSALAEDVHAMSDLSAAGHLISLTQIDAHGAYGAIVAPSARDLV